MLMRIGHPARLATMVMLAAAVLAPAAGAGRYGPGTTSGATLTRQASPPAATCHQYCGVAVAPGRGAHAPASRAVVQTELVPSADAGFQWADAAVGFGFAVACGAMLLILVAVRAGRRTRVRAAGGAS
jgi:hypothetical protein